MTSPFPRCLLADDEPENSERDWRTLERQRQETHPEQISYPQWTCSHAERKPANPNFRHVPTPRQREHQTIRRPEFRRAG